MECVIGQVPPAYAGDNEPPRSGRNLPHDGIWSSFIGLIFVFMRVDPAGGRCEILKEPVGREFSRGSKEVFLVWESTKGILLRNDLCSLSLI